MPDPNPQNPPSPSPTPANPSGDPAAPPAPAAPAALSRPEGLPDKYWDPATGLRAREVAQTLSELDTANTKRAETFKEFPADVKKAGEFYKLPENLLPDGVTLPQGQTQMPIDQGLIDAVLPVVHQHQADPALFQDAARAITGYNVAKFNAAAREFAEDRKKLGANAAARSDDINARMKAAIGDKWTLDANAMTSAGVEMFEAIAKSLTTQLNVVPPGNGRTQDPPAPAPKSHAEHLFGNTMKAS